ncbi:glycosyltransferase family 2 protein [Sulfuriferula sp.]|uniref:glycosyltransferase family 2 protein n=1 Tax=Sulfuriferula sp. TaxID=2025307 RepID=UPI00272F1524|nr:glycosyltransferase family 2 protein [Sulfuriferula sp.]MDP2025293.1 glycosyltransferase family 2 protein [Sulfuriferula sp.]
MLISVTVPTHNRPELLREALTSVVAQTHAEWEVVVVDDGSTPPVAESTLHELLGERFVLVRHDPAQGIAAAKNAGVVAARGEVILHLDDDDLLTPTALAQIATAYARHPELECLFVNVEPFGTYAPGTAANQTHALSRLLGRARSIEENDVTFFNDRLFGALLKSVPMAMQRPAARKALWDKVGLLRKGSYMPEPEWAMKTALYTQPGVLLDPVSLFRVDGQNYVSQTVQKEKHLLAAVDIRNTLLAWIAEHPAFAGRVREVKHSLANVYFDQAYHYQHTGNYPAAWRPLLIAFISHPQWRSLRLATRLLLPSIKRPKAD